MVRTRLILQKLLKIEDMRANQISAEESHCAQVVLNILAEQKIDHKLCCEFGVAGEEGSNNKHDYAWFFLPTKTTRQLFILPSSSKKFNLSHGMNRL